jgi:hypothetical protein
MSVKFNYWKGITDMSADIHYFLCSNTCSGTYSIYDEIAKNDKTKFLYIIKGGPGCDKSGFLKVLGEGISKKGFVVEYIHCTQEPEGIDGIVVPELGIAYIDGTAPHILEAEYPGVTARYIDLDEFYDFAALAGKKELVKDIDAEYRSYRLRAFNFLSAASEIGREIYMPLLSDGISDTIMRRSFGICSREFSDKEKEGKVTRRFLSAFTYEGVTSRFDTVKALCERVCIIDNDYGFAPLMLHQLMDCALKCGYDVVLCLSPLYPDVPEHLVIPELSLAFLSVAPETEYDGKTFKHVRLDALVDKEKYREVKHALREERKLYDALLEKARKNFLFAKGAFDNLEAVYRPHVDLKGVYALAEKHAQLCK